MPDPDDDIRAITAWLAANVGGDVVRISRQPRWRPVWFADVERDGEVLELCVRGDRTDMPLIFPLDHEMRLQSTMHDHGIPTAKVYGWIDEPMAYVMTRVPGRNDFEQSTDAEHDAVIDDYLHILARLHALDIGPFVDAGIMRATRPRAVRDVRHVALRARLPVGEDAPRSRSSSSAWGGCDAILRSRTGANRRSCGTRASSTTRTAASSQCSTSRSVTSATR